MLTAATVLVIGGVASIVIASGEDDGSEGDSKAQLIVGSPESALLLTPDQSAEVRSIVDRDPRIQALIAGADYKTQELAEWTSSGDGDEMELIGGRISLAFERPLAPPDTSWPFIVFPPADNPELPYLTRDAKLHASKVRIIDAYVDLGERRVVAFMPGLGSRYEVLEVLGDPIPDEYDQEEGY